MKPHETVQWEPDEAIVVCPNKADLVLKYIISFSTYRLYWITVDQCLLQFITSNYFDFFKV